MMGNDGKQVTYDDKGVNKVFTVNALPAIPAILLLREITYLLADTELIKSVILRQFISNMIQTGSQSEDMDNEDYKKLLEMDMLSIVTHLIAALLKGLNDDNLQVLIYKCFENIIYHNGSQQVKGNDALQLNMIKDFSVILCLVKEVIVINYGGAIDRLKKHLAQKSETQKEEIASGAR